MSLLVAIPNRNIERLVSELEQRLGAGLVQQWPNVTDAHAVDMVLGWQVPAELWSMLPNVQAVSSFGAGVDGLNLGAIPKHLPISRIVDPNLAADMAEYVLGQVLFHKLNMPRYVAQQRQQVWRPKRVKGVKKVGLLGYGQLGKAIAQRLVENHFEVMAWSHSVKADAHGVTHYSAQSGLAQMLPRCDYLVCVLPLTAQTTHIINTSLLQQLPNHCVLINVGRGQHIDDQALVDALENAQLAGASLDVFSEEPLAQQHPFWGLDNVVVTPHCSALSDINTVVEQVVENYRRLQNKQTLLHCINRDKQY